MRIDQRVLRVLGIDFHILQTLVQRLWMTVAGAAMVVLIPLFLSPSEQGYYFTFASIIALQIFFELGLNYVVIQLVGHEISHLRVNPEGYAEGEAARLGRLASLLRLLIRWYLVASILFFLGVTIAGFVFFTRTGDLPTSSWLGVWFALAAFSSVNLFYSPLLAVLEGAGQIGQVARVRLWQSVAGYGLMWLALFLGAGLWAAVLLPAATAVFSGVWLVRSGKLLHGLRRHPVDPDNTVLWRTEIFPFQWRIAVSWISGYFILQLFTPMIFAYQGSAEAGRIGISLVIFTSLQTLGMSWIIAKTPVFAGAIAQGQRGELNRLFKASALRAFSFVLLGCIGVVAVITAARWMGIELADRIADLQVLLCLAAATLANTLVFAAAAYMRAHKEEPMLVPSLAAGVATLVGVWLSAPFGTLATMLVYAGVTVLLALPWTALIFLGYYRRTA